MYQTGKLIEIERELEKIEWDMVGLQETRWTDRGEMTTTEGSKLISSCYTTRHERGVGYLINKKIKNTLLEWNPISNRILYARFSSRHIKLSVVVCYAPTDREEEKDAFYPEL